MPKVNDKLAAQLASDIRAKFWEQFEATLAPNRASKQCYLEQLEELASDADARIQCVRDELHAEQSEKER